MIYVNLSLIASYLVKNKKQFEKKLPILNGGLPNCNSNDNILSETFQYYVMVIMDASFLPPICYQIMPPIFDFKLWKWKRKNGKNVLQINNIVFPFRDSIYRAHVIRYLYSSQFPHIQNKFPLLKWILALVYYQILSKAIYLSWILKNLSILIWMVSNR